MEIDSEKYGNLSQKNEFEFTFLYKHIRGKFPSSADDQKQRKGF